MNRRILFFTLAIVTVLAGSAAAVDTPADPPAPAPVLTRDSSEYMDEPSSAPVLKVVTSDDPAASAASALARPNVHVATPPTTTAGAAADATAARIVERMLGEIARTEGEPRLLGLAEAVRAAVENNPGIRSRAEFPNRQAWAPYGATGAFDPKFRLNGAGSETKSPSGSALASGLPTFEERAVRAGTSISKLLRTGANVELAWQTALVDTNSRFYVINPRYDNRLVLSLRQPLLRNFWASRENTTVLVARSQAEESLAAFEADLSRFVSRVIDVYWGYLQAAAELEVSRRSVALAQELVRDAEAKVDVGLLAPVAVKEALADAAAREERAIVADNALTIAGRDLQHEVQLGAAANKAPEPVLPVEEHLVTPVELDRAESLRTAVQTRAEIRAATHVLGRMRLEEKNARNQRLPDLNLVAHYGQLGLAGNAKAVPVDPDCEGIDCEVQFSPYDGGYGDSLSQWFDEDFNDYAVGLEFEIPFGNAAANAALAQREIDGWVYAPGDNAIVFEHRGAEVDNGDSCAASGVQRSVSTTASGQA